MARSYSTATGTGMAYNWTGSRNQGRWQTKFARRGVVHTGEAQVAKRKTETETLLYKSSLKSWKGNEWAKKALDEAWTKNIKGYRTMSMLYSPDKDVTDWDTGAVTGVSKGGYSGLSSKGMNQFGYEIAARAKVLHSESLRSKESEQILSERMAKGGMGSRGSTMLTGGHKGVLAEAKIKRKSLIGSKV